MDEVLYVLLGAVCLTIIAIALLRRGALRRATARDLTRADRSQLREQRAVQQSLEALLGQIEEVSSRVGAESEARLSKLQTLVAVADERLARLPAPSAGPAAPVSQGRGGPAVHEPGGCAQQVFELADQGAAALAIADALRMPVGEVELLLNLRSFR